MPNLRFKSDENLTAAQELANRRLFTASVHCAYYSCLQHMKWILHHKLSKDYSTQEIEGGSESHNYLLAAINSKASSQTLARDINTVFKWLKSERIRADYTTEVFTDLESLDVIKKSKTLHAKLNQQFGSYES